ncbi:MAG: hypothetical protein GY914_06970, partial [Prochlorococcus sp.]|nr:hypothetical protein [Prochlorococcus sp.]
AKAAGDVGSTKVNLYGDGQVLSMKGSGKVTQVPIHRIATYENQQTIANKYGIDRADKKLLDQAIKSEGYMAIQQGSNQVRKIK